MCIEFARNKPLAWLKIYRCLYFVVRSTGPHADNLIAPTSSAMIPISSDWKTALLLISFVDGRWRGFLHLCQSFLVSKRSVLMFILRRFITPLWSVAFDRLLSIFSPQTSIISRMDQPIESEMYKRRNR